MHSLWPHNNIAWECNPKGLERDQAWRCDAQYNNVFNQYKIRNTWLENEEKRNLNKEQLERGDGSQSVELIIRTDINTSGNARIIFA